MGHLTKIFRHGIEGIAAGLLAAMFLTFLLQIFSRYVLQAPFGWTLELCLILWVWIVFLGNAFIVRERDHVTFDLLYLAAPERLRRVLALFAAGAILIGMAWSFIPTLDYIDWMKMRKTATVREPFTGSKIPMRTVFSVYLIFLVAIILRYGWRLQDIWRNGLSAQPAPDVEAEKEAIPREPEGQAR